MPKDANSEMREFWQIYHEYKRSIGNEFDEKFSLALLRAKTGWNHDTKRELLNVIESFLKDNLFTSQEKEKGLTWFDKVLVEELSTEQLDEIGAKLCRLEKRHLQSPQQITYLGTLSFPNCAPYAPCQLSIACRNGLFHLLNFYLNNALGQFYVATTQAAILNGAVIIPPTADSQDVTFLAFPPHRWPIALLQGNQSVYAAYNNSGSFVRRSDTSGILSSGGTPTGGRGDQTLFSFSDGTSLVIINGQNTTTFDASGNNLGSKQTGQPISGLRGPFSDLPTGTTLLGCVTAGTNGTNPTFYVFNTTTSTYTNTITLGIQSSAISDPTVAFHPVYNNLWCVSWETNDVSGNRTIQYDCFDANTGLSILGGSQTVAVYAGTSTSLPPAPIIQIAGDGAVSITYIDTDNTMSTVSYAISQLAVVSTPTPSPTPSPASTSSTPIPTTIASTPSPSPISTPTPTPIYTTNPGITFQLPSGYTGGPILAGSVFTFNNTQTVSLVATGGFIWEDGGSPVMLNHNYTLVQFNNFTLSGNGTTPTVEACNPVFGCTTIAPTAPLFNVGPNVALIGGVVGAVAVTILIVGGIIYILDRRRRIDDQNNSLIHQQKSREVNEKAQQSYRHTGDPGEYRK
jgi:hypothetical protein